MLNSHLLSEVELVCDRVAIIDHGRVVRSGPLEELIGATTTIRVTVDRVDRELRSALKRHADLLAEDGTTVTLGVTDVAVAPLIADTVVRGGYELHGLVPVHRSLEDVFIDLVEGGGP